MKFNHNLALVGSALVLSAMLLFADNLESAYAYSFTELGDGVDELAGLAVIGDYVYAGTDVNTVRVYARDTGVLQQAVTGCTGCQSSAIVYNNRAYFLGTSTLYEVDRTSGGVFVISRSVTTTSQCYGFQASLDTSTGILYCGRASTNDDIRGFDLDTMTMVYDSASINTGGTPCNDPQFPMVNDGYYIIHCPSGTARENVYALQSETVLHSLLVGTCSTGRECQAINTVDDTFIMCPDFCDIFEYSVAGGFVTVAVNIAGTSSSGDTVIYDNVGKRFILWSAGPERIFAVDANLAEVLWDVQTPCTLGGNQNGMFQTTANIIYFSCAVNGGGSDFYYRFDLTGLDVGSGGSASTGSVCSIDTNGDGVTDVTYTDTNGDGVCDAGSTINVITNPNPPADAIGGLLCQIGLIEDCTDNRPTNTDITTNGVGLILFFSLLVLMMAIVGVALYGKVALEYNLIVQIAILLIASGIAVAFGWIEDLWFYVMLFIIIGFAGLAGAKFAVGKLKGR